MKRLSALVLLLAPFFSAATAAQGFAPTASEEAKVISSLGVAPGKVIGDIGAGDGQLAIRIAKEVGPGGRVFGSELGQSKQDTLKQNAERAGVKNLRVVDAQATTTGLPADCCDAVYLRDVYHHLVAPDEILADIKKALHADGRLLVIDFEPRSDLPAVDGVRENRRGHGIPMAVLVDEIKAAGFEIVSQDAKWREDLFAVIARKPKGAFAPPTAAVH